MCDISSLRVNGPSEPGRLRDVCVCQWVNVLNCFVLGESFEVKVKFTLEQATKAPRRSRSIALLFL